MHKNIVITGATDGIGLAAAKSIAKKDYNLILVGRNPEKGKKALETVSYTHLTLPTIYSV